VQVYAVDDDPDITWLYTMLLEEQGYEVRAFHDRMVALSALRADRKCPALLITDYAGCSMQVTEFMESCRAIQPNLRILMITGFYPTDLYLPGIRPDRILQKPFDLKVLGNEVGAVLRSRWPFSDPTACQQHQE
jgi:two-component system response regulator ChvI